MSSTWKTYHVTFCVRDYYALDVKARSECEAIARAEDIYTRAGEEPFEFDISRGSTDEWDAEVIA